MDKKISKYFCIFCENCCKFNTINDAYNHYKQHMKKSYYCLNCDNNINKRNDKKCDQNHNQSKNDIIGPEEGLIEMWIERFLSYQNELIDKTFSDLIMGCKLFNGCPVCESFLRLCDNNNISYNYEEIRWSNNQSAANECRHACSHLRYYPFECLKCEKVGRYHKKCDTSEITRHIKDSHAVVLKADNFEALVKSVKIRKLESFIELSFANKPNSNSIDDNISISPSKPIKTYTNKSKAITTTTANTTANTNTNTNTSTTTTRTNTSTKTTTNSIPIKEDVCEPKPKKPKIETRIIITNNSNTKETTLKTNDNKNTTICKDNGSIILSIDKKQMNNKQIDCSDQKTAKVEIKFKPVMKTYSNTHMISTTKPKQSNLISGDQIIIKKPINDCAKIEVQSAQNTPSKPMINNCSQQFIEFNDFVEDESMEMTSNTNIEFKNVIYFCIFCTEKLATKEIAYKHYQQHLDYYPIMCLTCGEGLSDLQSFLCHHRETHPEAVKGRYKKKEQPIIDKWISSFLYSQATIIKAFPPREQCPVCDRVFTREEIDTNRPRRCTINRRIDHLHRHISYLPYECLKCKESGTEFFVAYFESKAHSHIKQKHPEIDDNESRWHVFQKTVFIPKLDEFIENYLRQFGISMEYERRPIKKSKQYSQQEFNRNTLNSIELNESLMDYNMVFSDIIDSAKVLELNNSFNANHKKDMDLIVIDDNDININHYNNNSNDSNIVVNVSPHSLLDKSVSDNTDELDSYFCIFCPKVRYFSKTDVYSHYGEHLDYLPVICKKCGSKFSNVDYLMAHHQSTHSTQSNVDYEIREDQILMKWVNEFLESQFDYKKAIKKVMPCSCSYNCPVCVKLVGNELSADSMPCTEHNDVSFSVHIHQHLVYYPYECVICKRNGKTVRVPNLDSIAMNHMKEHKVENSSMTQLCKNFPKTLVIPKLEKIIGDSVHRKRVSEKKNKLDTSLIFSQLQEPTTSHLCNNELISEQTTSLSPQSKTQHIRLEGRRVVNLPPKANADNSSTNVQSVSNEPLVTVTNNVRCILCQKSFPNKRLFKDHHNVSHPGKAIVCSIPKSSVTKTN